MKEPTVQEIVATDYPGREQCIAIEVGGVAHALAAAFAALEGRTVWHVNSTAAGGGVAELLYGYLRRHNREGVRTGWLVADASDEFFAITKGLFFRLYSHPNSAPALTSEDRRTYTEVTARHGELALEHVKAGDVAILHDPQTVGMAQRLSKAGVVVVWQCHIGSLMPSERQNEAWDFLEPFLEGPDAVIFSHPAYPPDRLVAKSHIIMPAIDEYSSKNRVLDASTVQAIVTDVGLMAPDGPARDEVTGRRQGWAADLATVTQTAAVPPGSHVLLQVSRWDETKGLLGVLDAFTTSVARSHPELHLVLLGPDPTAVADDPGGQEVFDAALAHVVGVKEDVRRRVHLVRTSGTDLEGTAFIVNAVQQWADLISQKSLCEGFGLTVTEAKWKSKPVIAAAVGGIPSQLRDGDTGLLVTNSHDLTAFAAAVSALAGDDKLRARLARRAHEDVVEHFLFSRQLADYLRVYESVLR